MGKCNCGIGWTGATKCHCTGCHETFSSVSAFDKHRTGKEGERRCMDIQEMQKAKMVFQSDKGYWVGAEMPKDRVFGK